jgi:hypothetical protein
VAVVYIVTTGSYSDYTISSVWDNRADADREAAKFKGEGYVEEYVLNSSEKPHPPLWMAKYRNGIITVPDRATAATDAGDIATEVWKSAIEGKPAILAHAWGISPEIARKNVADAVAKWRAEHDGL